LHEDPHSQRNHHRLWQPVTSQRYREGRRPGQRNVHHAEADTKPPPFSEPKRDKEKANFKDDCQTKKVPLNKHMPDKMVTISATLGEAEEKELLEFQCKNKDVFAWFVSDLLVSVGTSSNTGSTSSLRSSPRSKNCEKCPMTRSQQSKRRFRGCKMPMSSEKSGTQHGWQTLCQSRRKTVSGACALILLT
jgi:hypothetical protein